MKSVLLRIGSIMEEADWKRMAIAAMCGAGILCFNPLAAPIPVLFLQFKRPAKKPKSIHDMVDMTSRNLLISKSTFNTIIRHRETVVPELIEALKNPDYTIKYNAIWLLKTMKDKRAVPALIKALEDKSVRMDAAWALGEIGDASAVPALSKALKDKDKFVRSHAAVALGNIGDARAVPALIKLLNDITVNDRDTILAENVAYALANIRTKEAIAALRNAKKQHPNPYVKREATEALGKIAKPKNLIKLIPRMDNNPYWFPGMYNPYTQRSEASLVARHRKSAVPELIEALKNSDVDNVTRGNAAKLLGYLKERSAVPALIATLKDESIYVRKWAASALGDIGDASAVPALTETLDDKDESVVVAAAYALANIRTKEAIAALKNAEKQHPNSAVRSAATKALQEIETRPRKLKGVKIKKKK